MEQFKRAQVVMLHTSRNSGCLTQNRHTGKLSYQGSASSADNRHLYIISDDEIKEGDWCLIDGNKIGKRTNKQTYPDCTDGESHLCYYYIINGEERSYHVSHCKKIITTTDTSLKPSCTCTESAAIYCGSKCQISLPQPSQQFIEKYIEEYNKGKKITDVMVEYENIIALDGHTVIGIELKINPKDNTITIKKVKDSWNREEVVELLNKLNNTLNIGSDLTLEQWIRENL